MCTTVRVCWKCYYHFSSWSQVRTLQAALTPVQLSEMPFRKLSKTLWIRQWYPICQVICWVHSEIHSWATQALRILAKPPQQPHDQSKTLATRCDQFHKPHPLARNQSLTLPASMLSSSGSSSASSLITFITSLTVGKTNCPISAVRSGSLTSC